MIQIAFVRVVHVWGRASVCRKYWFEEYRPKPQGELISRGELIMYYRTISLKVFKIMAFKNWQQNLTKVTKDLKTPQQNKYSVKKKDIFVSPLCFKVFTNISTLSTCSAKWIVKKMYLKLSPISKIDCLTGSECSFGEGNRL